MTQRLAPSIFCGSVVVLAVLSAACATKSFVEKQVGATESKLTEQMTTSETTLSKRAESQETKLREIEDRAGENRQAIDATDQRLQSLDMRTGMVHDAASQAKTEADQAKATAHDVEARLSQRLAGRNRYRLMDTKVIYFDSGQSDIRSQDTKELDAVAKALAADPNAVLELQGFADARGDYRYNVELGRQRVENVMRYLVGRHRIELRQLQALPMGEAALAAGQKPTPEALARARRVDIRLFTPWSSWEDAVTENQAAPGQTVTAIPEPAASVATDPLRPAGVPAQREPTESTQAPQIDTSAPRLSEFLKTVTPKDLGGD